MRPTVVAQPSPLRHSCLRGVTGTSRCTLIMNRSTQQSPLDRLPAWLLALLALALGGLLALALMTTPPGQVGLADSRLTDIVLPLAAAGCLIALSLYSPLAGFLAWIALAPYSQHLALDLRLGAGIPDLSLSRMLAGFLLLLVITQAALGKRTLRPLAWSDLAYALFLFGLLFSVPQTVYGKLEGVQTILDAYIVPFIALFIARQVVRNQRDLRWLTVVLMASAVAFSLLIIREQLTGEVLLYSRGGPLQPQLPKGHQPDGQRRAHRRQHRDGDSAGPDAAGPELAGRRAGHRRAAAGATDAGGRAGHLRVGRLHDLQPGELAGGCGDAGGVAGAAATDAAHVVAGVAAGGRAGRHFLAERRQQPGGHRTAAGGRLSRLSHDSAATGAGYGRGQSGVRTGLQQFRLDRAPQLRMEPQPAVRHRSAGPQLLHLFPGLRRAGGAAALPRVDGAAGLAGISPLSVVARPALDRDALAAGAAVFLTYFLASGTFDNLNHLAMNLIFYAVIGSIWGATEYTPHSALSSPRTRPLTLTPYSFRSG